jgi:predicted Fe-S protein YdhL (DUF1289 family)
MAVDSPCVGVCRMHSTYRICKGCYRSALEIRIWNIAEDTTKEKIIKGLLIKKKIYGDLKDA